MLVHPRDNDLIVATHGRGLWILDNIASLEALTPDSVVTDAFLVTPARGRLLSIYTPQAWFGAGQYFASNPESGASIDYFLRTPPAREIVVRVADAHGTLVRTLKGTARAGLNHVSWDMRMESPLPEEPRDVSPGGIGTLPAGPLVLPGSYSVSIDGAPRPLKGELKIDGDPRVVFSDADRRGRQAALLDLYTLMKTLGAARVAAGSGVAHAEGTNRAAPGDLQDPAEKFRGLRARLGTLITAANTLSRSIEGYSGLPTVDQRRQIDWAFGDSREAIDGLNRAMDSDGARAPLQLSVPKRQ
jgi:hypothetical protein